MTNAKKIWLRFKCIIGLHQWSQFGRARRCDRCQLEQTSTKVDIWIAREGDSEFIDFHYINKEM